MVIRKGSVYWVDFSPGKGSEPLGIRPGLVIQSDVLNDSKISTVTMVAITSTLKFGELPGNVVLDECEANLPRDLVPNLSSPGQTSLSNDQSCCHSAISHNRRPETALK